MSGELASTLLKLLLPLAGSALLLYVTNRRGIAWGANLGLVPPNRTHFMLWIALWIAWLSFSEAAVRVFGLGRPTPWPWQPWYIVWMRVLAIGFAGPFIEELVFRGLLLDRLGRTRLTLGGAILVTAVVWAAMHYRYGPGLVFLIACDGVFLGLARVRGRSLWIPITLHMMGNWVSIYQSTHM